MSSPQANPHHAPRTTHHAPRTTHHARVLRTRTPTPIPTPAPARTSHQPGACASPGKLSANGRIGGGIDYEKIFLSAFRAEPGLCTSVAADLLRFKEVDPACPNMLGVYLFYKVSAGVRRSRGSVVGGTRRRVSTSAAKGHHGTGAMLTMTLLRHNRASRRSRARVWLVTTGGGEAMQASSSRGCCRARGRICSASTSIQARRAQSAASSRWQRGGIVGRAQRGAHGGVRATHCAPHAQQARSWATGSLSITRRGSSSERRASSGTTSTSCTT